MNDSVWSEDEYRGERAVDVRQEETEEVPALSAILLFLMSFPFCYISIPSGIV